jgi:prevent-host-death family protein
MKTVTVHKAKTTLSQLIAAAEAGEDVVIQRGPDPVVRLVPINRAEPRRQFGALAGKVSIGPEFFEPLPETELARWES